MEYKSAFFLFSSGLLFFALSCAKTPEFSVVPEITFVGLNQDTILQNGGINPRDTLDITFSFTDGDGDIGSEEDINIFLTDSRNDFPLTFKVNPIPEQGIDNGIKGEITLSIPNDQICCVLPTNQTCIPSSTYPVDVMHYSIQLLDRLGNESNIVDTDDIFILCQ